jgi:hypothetical protein
MMTNGMPGARGAILRRGLAQLVVIVLLTYGLGLLGSVVASNAVRGLVGVQVDLLTPAGRLAPTWVGLLAYVQGAAALAAVALLAGAVLLAGTVQVTRSARRGEQVPLSTPLRRGLPRVPAVARGLAVVLPLAASVLLLSVVLLVLLVVVVPVAAVVALVWWRRPSARRAWMRWAAAAAVPMGLVAVTLVRWVLWLPFVVDGAGVRSALRRSAAASGGRALRTARPLAAVASTGVVLSPCSGPRRPPACRRGGRGGRGAAARRPPGRARRGRHGAAGGGRAGGRRAEAAHPHAPRLARGTAPPRPSPCSWSPCWRRAAGRPRPRRRSCPPAPPSWSTAWPTRWTPRASAPGGRARCARLSRRRRTGPRSGSAPAAPSSWCRRCTCGGRSPCDGAGQRVALRSPEGAGASAVLLGAGSTSNGGEETPPSEGGEQGGETPPSGGEPSAGAQYVLRNLTFLGRPGGDASGVVVGGGSVTVDSSTFTGHRVVDGYGSAISVGGGALSVENSTFVDNSASDGGQPVGGAVAAFAGTSLAVNASTFVDNHGGGVWGPVSATVTNSLFGGASGFNCRVQSSSGNVSNDGSCATGATSGLTRAQLLLGPLGDNGGAVDTVPLRAGSPAIGAGDPGTCPDDDARGQLRGGTCDAGAYQTSSGTTTTVSTRDNPVPFGGTVTVTVRVDNPQGAPTGSVELSGTAAGTQTAALVAGVATFTLTPDVGSHVLQAAYVPDAGLTASSGSLVLEVVAQVSATTLTVSPAGSSAPGTPVTLTAAVRNGADVRAAQPTGSVDFSARGTALGSGTLADGVATWTGQLPLGVNDLTAVYVPSNGFSASTGTATHSVQSVSTVTLEAPAAVVHGAAFSLTATVPAAATGTVVFTARTSDRVWSSPPVDVTAGTATAQWTQVLTPGQWSFTAEYRGDATHAPSVSAPGTTTVRSGRHRRRPHRSPQSARRAGSRRRSRPPSTPR